MKPFSAIFVFAVILFSSVISSINCYKTAEDNVVTDLNQALSLTIERNQEAALTPDTIRDYRKFLTIPMLRERASLSYSISNGGEDVLCSDTMTWREGGKTVNFRGYANCSFAAVFSLSDQKTSATLSALAMLWALFCGFYFRRQHRNTIMNLSTYGGISYDEMGDFFINANHEPIHLTPMQHRLMRMFFAADDHRLSQKDICEALWPKKDDPNETLYTLIRRLKPTLEKNSKVKIESDRGHGYRLKV